MSWHRAPVHSRSTCPSRGSSALNPTRFDRPSSSDLTRWPSTPPTRFQWQITKPFSPRFSISWPEKPPSNSTARQSPSSTSAANSFAPIPLSASSPTTAKAFPPTKPLSPSFLQAHAPDIRRRPASSGTCFPPEPRRSRSPFDLPATRRNSSSAESGQVPPGRSPRPRHPCQSLRNSLP